MYCNKCGHKLNENDIYCIGCGNNINQYSEVQSTSISFDERFIKSYIGEKVDKMYNSVKDGGINIWALLFGVEYYVYRKMYLVSIIIIIVTGIITLVVPDFPREIIGMFIGGMFCPLYKWDITRKLRRIKRDNPNASENDLIEKAKKSGGTSWWGVVFFSIILIVSIIWEVKK